jgi:hypothetical protein
MSDESPAAIKEPWVIVCEGDADKFFFRKLLALNDIIGVEAPFPTKSDEGGIGQFARFLQGLERYFDLLTGVVLVADSTNDRNKIFRDVCKKIKQANRDGSLDYPIRKELKKIEGKAGRAPSVVVITLPIDGAGGLETLCVEALSRRYPKVRKCVESFLKCSGVDKWGNQEKIDKARFQALIAGGNKDDPNKSLKNMLDYDLIPLDHGCFKSVVDFLKALPTQLRQA